MKETFIEVPIIGIGYILIRLSDLAGWRDLIFGIATPLPFFSSSRTSK